jgi:uncharacterized protein with PQ loop repeat
MQAIYRFHLWSASMLQEVIAFVYTANGVLVSLIYLPQLHTVWNDRTGAQAGSLLTWSLFSVSSVVALLYGVLVLHDGRMVFAAGSSTAGSLSVLGTAVYRRQQAKRQRYPRRTFPSTPRLGVISRVSAPPLEGPSAPATNS